MAKKSKNSNKLLWSLLFLVIAAATVWAVAEQSRSFSLGGFLQFVKGASPIYLVLAFLSVFCFVLFEGLAILCVLKALGYKSNVSGGLLYSASDIYFSAITPSATGGQPVSAYFMMKNGIPAAVTTVTLLLNLLMYTLAIVFVGVVCFVFNTSVFINFGTVSKVFIIVGFFLQIGLVILFFAALKRENEVKKVFLFFVNLLSKLHVIRKKDKYVQKTERMFEEYRQLSEYITGKVKSLFGVFVFNVLQRSFLSLTTVFVYLASGGSLNRAFDVWSAQTYTVIGSNCIPVPGAMGISDYLLLDSFKNLVKNPVNLELLSRTVSFYICVLACGGYVLVRYLLLKLKKKKVLS